MTTEGANTLKVRLVIPICDRVFGRFYCRDACYPDERKNLLEKAFNTAFKRKGDSYPDLVITSNNFIAFEPFQYVNDDILISFNRALGNEEIGLAQVLLKSFLEKISLPSDLQSIDLVIGIDSFLPNPYDGILANVFHFRFENNEWSDPNYIWECWRKCKADCCREERLIEKYGLAFYSCGDILRSCCNNNRNRNFSARIIVDLAHMDFCPECFRSYISRRNFAGTILRTINNHSFLIITTQICRDHTNILDKIQTFFERGKYKLILQGDNTASSSNLQQNNPLEAIKNYILSEQTIIALDKQSTNYEIIEDWENPNSFENEEKLNQVDAFFIDFEISFNGNE